MKKVFIAVGAIFLGLILLALLLPAFLDLSPQGERLTRSLSEALGRRVELEGFRLRLLPRVALIGRELTVYDEPEFGGEPALTAKSLRVSLKWLPLLRGRVEVARVSLARPALTLRRNMEGRYNFISSARPPVKEPSPPPEGALPGAPPTPLPEKAPPPLFFLAAALRVEGGRMSFIDERASPGTPHLTTIEGLSLRAEPPSPAAPSSFRLLARRPELEVRGKLGPVDPEEPFSSPFSGDLSAKGIELASLGKYIRELSGRLPLRVEKGRADLKLSFKGRAGKKVSLKGEIRLHGVSLAQRGSSGPLAEGATLSSQVEAQYEWEGEKLNLSHLELHGGELSVKGRGSLRRPFGEERELTLELELKSADLKSLMSPPLRRILPWPEGLRAEGDALARVKVEGKMREGLKVRSSLYLDGSSLSLGRYFQKQRGVPLQLVLVGEVGKEALHFSLIQLQLGSLVVGGRGTLSEPWEGQKLNLLLTSQPMNLEKVTLFSPRLEPFELSGQGRLELSFEGSLSRLNGGRARGSLQLANVGLTLPGVEKPVESLSGFFELKEGVISGRNISWKMGGSTFSLDGTLEGIASPRLNFRLHSRRLLLDELIPERGHRKEQPRRAKTLLSSSLIPMASAESGGNPSPPVKPSSLLHRIKARGLLGVDSGRFKGVRFERLKGEISYEKGDLTFEHLSARLFGGEAFAEGKLNFSGGPPRYHFSLNLHGAELGEVAALWGKGNLLRGELSGTLELVGSGFEHEALRESLQGEGRVEVGGGSIYPLELMEEVRRFYRGREPLGETPFQGAGASFKVARGEVRTSDLNLRADGLRLEGEGALSFEGNLDFKASAILSGKWARYFMGRDLRRFLEDSKGRITIPFVIERNFRNPLIRLDPERANLLMKGFLGPSKGAKEEQKDKLREGIKELLRKILP